MQRLAGEPGPVLVDPPGRAVYFFVPARTRWSVDDTTAGAAISLPLPRRSATKPPGPYWLVQPDDSLALADPVALSVALSALKREWVA
jgi:hypothetical protein